jgi:hypothetical protein
MFQFPMSGKQYIQLRMNAHECNINGPLIDSENDGLTLARVSHGRANLSAVRHEISGRGEAHA